MHMRDFDAFQKELTGFSDRMWKRERRWAMGALRCLGWVMCNVVLFMGPGGDMEKSV